MLRSIVLPAFNEAGYIAEMVRRTIEAGATCPDEFEIIVINNASTDRTADIVEGISARDPRVKLISHPENRRYAASCLTGTRAATGERIFIIDSDGQHPPADLWKFDARLAQGCDIVFGWRTHREESLQRLAMSRVLWSLARLYLGFRLHDVNCGIRGFNRAYAERLVIKHRVNLVNPELYVRARQGDFRICEVAVVQEKRKAGVSSHELGRLMQIFGEVTDYLGKLRGELTPAQRRRPPEAA
jgi:glycosyltransferase involved in cell wall biosynthesis